MAMFSESGLAASGYRDKIRLCPRCGRSLTYIDGHGYCCEYHGCWWPKEEGKAPEDKKARCYHQGEVKKTSSSKGRKRKKNRKEQWISDYIET